MYAHQSHLKTRPLLNQKSHKNQPYIKTTILTRPFGPKPAPKAKTMSEDDIVKKLSEPSDPSLLSDHEDEGPRPDLGFRSPLRKNKDDPVDSPS